MYPRIWSGRFGQKNVLIVLGLEPRIVQPLSLTLYEPHYPFTLNIQIMLVFHSFVQITGTLKIMFI